MGDVTAVMMDVITEKSGHQVVPNAVSVCITPAAPSPLPIPYPVIAQVGEGITDPPMRTKVNGSPIATTGSVLKACHGNEPGTLKEVVSLNTGGPVFIIVGAPNAAPGAKSTPASAMRSSTGMQPRPLARRSSPASRGPSQ